jgi:hypothetical protein
MLIALLVAARSDAAPPDFPPESLDAAALMVRLSDLPPGYLVDDPGCGLDLENAPPRLALIIRTHLPDRCVIDFFHRRGVPTILSAALAAEPPTKLTAWVEGAASNLPGVASPCAGVGRSDCL